ncbi:MAG: metallophosphoesterase [Candidatus Parvarchaeum acidiphilum ARMAN-4]|uniref:Metallophosphoesterase n=1 Tax=Candidatus Parvarchaeum acidiphilum ARMAN-4 TaxID=662760 RepID=D2EEH5_PARA4|nr:MAG: metallophosphoesterase [Candidatus Parvarchaeum acidiphilum ARMAN-4]
MIHMEIEDFDFRFKKGSRAVFVGDYAIVGDIHLGFEEEINDYGYNIWEKTDEITGKLTALNSKKLILLGDIRKEYTQIKPKEGGVLIKFFSNLSNNFDEVILTKGNHDGGIEKITGRFNNIFVKNEFIHNKIGFMHGHAFPSMEFINSVNTLCMSHIHPSFTFKDSNGVTYKEDCFLMLKIKLPKTEYPSSKLKNALVLPKFNPYIGSSTEINNRGILKYSKIETRMTLDLAVF